MIITDKNFWFRSASEQPSLAEGELFNPEPLDLCQFFHELVEAFEVRIPLNPQIPCYTVE